jgi:hypothetical protein
MSYSGRLWQGQSTWFKYTGSLLDISYRHYYFTIFPRLRTNVKSVAIYKHLLLYNSTRYGLNCSGIESRWEARYFAPVQTGPGAHPVSYRVSFPGVKQPVCEVIQPPKSRAEGNSITIRLLPFRVFITCFRANLTSRCPKQVHTT